MSILVLGTSHIRWLEIYLSQTNGANMFNLNPTPEINFSSISGGKIENRTHLRRWETTISSQRPKYLIVQFGGNDLDRPNMSVDAAETLSLRLVNLCMLYQTRYGISQIVVMQLLPRHSPRHVTKELYIHLNHTANRVLKQELKQLPSIHYWNVKGVKAPTKELYRDGVHFNDVGMKRYANNVRGAIIQMLKK